MLFSSINKYLRLVQRRTFYFYLSCLRSLNVASAYTAYIAVGLPAAVMSVVLTILPALLLLLLQLPLSILISKVLNVHAYTMQALALDNTQLNFYNASFSNISSHDHFRRSRRVSEPSNILHRRFTSACRFCIILTVLKSQHHLKFDVKSKSNITRCKMIRNQNQQESHAIAKVTARCAIAI